MAALAIPIVILGSIYILSEQEKKVSAKNIATQENFQKKIFCQEQLNKVKIFQILEKK